MGERRDGIDNYTLRAKGDCHKDNCDTCCYGNGTDAKTYEHQNIVIPSVAKHSKSCSSQRT